MRKLVLFLEAGVGTKEASAWLISDEVSQEDLEDFAEQQALEHAESYGRYPESQRPEDASEDEEDDYSDDIDGWWEAYDSDKHDGQLTYGSNSSFEWSSW